MKKLSLVFLLSIGTAVYGACSDSTCARVGGRGPKVANCEDCEDMETLIEKVNKHGVSLSQQDDTLLREWLEHAKLSQLGDQPLVHTVMGCCSKRLNITVTGNGFILSE